MSHDVVECPICQNGETAKCPDYQEAYGPSATETRPACRECDPPGSGKECRGGPCRRCRGTGEAR